MYRKRKTRQTHKYITTLSVLLNISDMVNPMDISRSKVGGLRPSTPALLVISSVQSKNSREYTLDYIPAPIHCCLLQSKASNSYTCCDAHNRRRAKEETVRDLVVEIHEFNTIHNTPTK